MWNSGGQKKDMQLLEDMVALLAAHRALQEIASGLPLISLGTVCTSFRIAQHCRQSGTSTGFAPEAEG